MWLHKHSHTMISTPHMQLQNANPTTNGPTKCYTNCPFGPYVTWPHKVAAYRVWSAVKGPHKHIQVYALHLKKNGRAIRGFYNNKLQNSNPFKVQPLQFYFHKHFQSHCPLSSSFCSAHMLALTFIQKDELQICSIFTTHFQASSDDDLNKQFGHH